MIGDEGLAVAEAYGLGMPTGAPVPVARGELGRIWRLDTDRGRWAVKELLFPMTEAEARADIAYQLTALGAGLPLPRPVTRRDGEVLQAVTRPIGAGATFRVYEWVDIAKPDRPPAPVVAAALLAGLHRLEVPADGPMDAWFAAPLGPIGWRTLVADVRSAAPPWLDQFERFAPEAEAAEAIVVEADLANVPISELRRCHLDFNRENVLVERNGDPVIVDWENSGPAPPEQELAMAVLDWAPEPAAAVAFVGTYRDAGGPAEISDQSSFAMAIAVQSHLADTYARRGITATTDEDRTRAAARIDELDRTLWTLAKIDGVLDALGLDP